MTEEQMNTNGKEQMSNMTAESAAVAGTSPRAVEGITPRADEAMSPQTCRWNRLLGPYAALAGNHNLAWLFGGQVVSSFGDWLYVTALIVLVYNLSHSATLAALLTAVRLLPYVVG